MKNRNKYSLEEMDFMRKLGIVYFNDEDSEEDDCHISDVSVAHNFMCDYCEHFLSKEDGFVLIPMSRIKEMIKDTSSTKENLIEKAVNDYYKEHPDGGKLKDFIEKARDKFGISTKKGCKCVINQYSPDEFICGENNRICTHCLKSTKKGCHFTEDNIKSIKDGTFKDKLIKEIKSFTSSTETALNSQLLPSRAELNLGYSQGTPVTTAGNPHGADNIHSQNKELLDKDYSKDGRKVRE